MTNREEMIQALKKIAYECESKGFPKGFPDFSSIKPFTDLYVYNVWQALMCRCTSPISHLEVFFDVGAPLDFKKQLPDISFNKETVYVFIISHYHYDHLSYFLRKRFPWEAKGQKAQRDKCWLIAPNVFSLDDYCKSIVDNLSATTLRTLYEFGTNDHLLLFGHRKSSTINEQNLSLFFSASTNATSQNSSNCIECIVNQKVFFFGDCEYLYSKIVDKVSANSIVQLSHHGFKSASIGFNNTINCHVCFASYSSPNIYGQKVNLQQPNCTFVYDRFLETPKSDNKQQQTIPL